MSIRLDDQVVIVTGAGGGLGRAHALALAARGASVVVNDVGPGGAAVASEIEEAGGVAFASDASVTDMSAVERMVAETLERFGRVDALVNNAGILRDKTFAKMTMDEFRAVLDVHLMGAVHCSKAVWAHMRERGYGRIVMTTSSSGLYGNFGQANYGAAKMALVGLMNVLAIEGRKDGIHVNCFAPTARTRMTEGLLPEAILARFAPETTSAIMVYLCSPEAPTKTIVCAGAGTYERAYVTMTPGTFLAEEERDVDGIAAAFAEISDRRGEIVPASGAEQGANELRRADEAARKASGVEA